MESVIYKMRKLIVLCDECRKPRDFSSQGFCESKNREVDLDITNAMIGFSHHIRLDQKRMLSIFCCHKDSRVMAFLHGLIISKLFVSDFFAKIKITTKKRRGRLPLLLSFHENIVLHNLLRLQIYLASLFFHHSFRP